MSRRVRDLVLFVAGLAGVAYTTIFQFRERPDLVVLFAAMLGLGQDLYRRDRNDNDRNDGNDKRPPQRRRR